VTPYSKEWAEAQLEVVQACLREVGVDIELVNVRSTSDPEGWDIFYTIMMDDWVGNTPADPEAMRHFYRASQIADLKYPGRDALVCFECWMSMEIPCAHRANVVPLQP
jgi:hypothetical protein